jgi:hypothetical protein
MTLNGLINAEHDFTAIGDWIKSVYDFIAADATVSDIWGKITSVFSVLPSVLVTALLLVLSLVEVFRGKRLIGIQKFFGSFVLGFAVSAAYLPGIVGEAVSPLILGLAVGVIAALLCKLVYFLLYVAVFGLGTYVACLGGYLLPEALVGFTKGNMMMSIAVAVVVLVVALILKKLIEMVGTATLGGFLAWLCIEELVLQFGFTPNEHSLSVFKLAVMIVLAFFGTVVQFKKRKRKW